MNDCDYNKLYRLKFEIFVAEEPKSTTEALSIIKAAIDDFTYPEDFIQWREEDDE